MVDSVENSDQDILNRFNRDKELMWPDDKFQDRALYNSYLRNLVDNPTFIQASRIADKKIAKAKSKQENKNRAAKIVVCVFLMLFFGGAGISGYKMPETYRFEQTQSQHIMFSLYMLAVMLTGVGLSAVIWSAKDNDPKYDERPEVFFNRLVARYFDVLKKMYPELSDKYLKMFNQPDMEMARTIYSLLIVNMSKKDVKKLTDIALSINWRVYNNNSEMDNMRDVEEKISRALAIIENTLTMHPELREAVKCSYMGNVPTTFFVVKAKENLESQL